MSQSTGSSAAIDPQATDGPWDQRTHPPVSRRRPIALIVASLVALGAGGPAAFFALRAQTAAHPTPGADASAARSAAPVGSLVGSAEAPQPTVLPGDPVGKPSASVVPTTGTAVAPPPEVPPSARPRRLGGPGPGPQPTAKPGKPHGGDDLFGTQK